jgi:folate-dependent phosphoribosylglycinamide formyltransferase PurN
MGKGIDIGWFSTGRDRAARELLRGTWDAISKKEIEGSICFVFCNREKGEERESDSFVELVRSLHLPLISLSSRRYKGSNYHQKVEELLSDFAPDIYFLCGYMLVVGKEIYGRHTTLNLHPSLPSGPPGTWEEVMLRIISDRIYKSGVMIHLVTSDLDQGPPLSYCSFSLRGEPFDKYWLDVYEKAEVNVNHPLFSLIREYELSHELPLIKATLNALSQGRISIKEEKVVDDQRKPVSGLDLTEEVDARLALFRP